MKRLFARFFSFLLKKLELTESKNTINPSTWNSSMVVISLWLLAINGIIYGIIFLLAAFIGLVIYYHEISFLIIKSSLYIGLVGLAFGLIRNYFTKKKGDAENNKNEEKIVDVPLGHAGIILFFGEIYGRDENFQTTAGKFKVGLEIPFFGQLFSIAPQPLEYDNYDLTYQGIPTSDAVYMKGKWSIEKEVVDIFTAYELETCTKEGIDGRIKEKTLELTNNSFSQCTVEEIIKSGNSVNGILLFRDKVKEQITAMTGEGKCFDIPKKPINSTTTRGADCYLKEAGVNLKFILKEQEPEDERLKKKFTDLSIKEAEIEEAELEAKIIKIKAEANAKAKKLEIIYTKEGEAQGNKALMKATKEMFESTFDKYESRLGAVAAAQYAALIAEAYAKEMLHVIGSPDGTPVGGEGFLLAAIDTWKGEKGGGEKSK